MNFTKIKNEFISRSIKYLSPEPTFFDKLVCVNDLPKAWYLSLNVNFRNKETPFEIKKIKNRLMELSNGELRIQPDNDLHCSLLHIFTVPFGGDFTDNNDLRKIIKNIFEKNKEDLERILNDFCSKEFEFWGDYIYCSRESLALQVFVDWKIFEQINEIKSKLETSRLKQEVENNGFIWKNEPKLNPKGANGDTDRWGAMNLIRYDKFVLNGKIATGLSKEIENFNQAAIKERNCYFSINFRTKPSLVISDHFFSENSETVI